MLDGVHSFTPTSQIVRQCGPHRRALGLNQKTPLPFKNPSVSQREAGVLVNKKTCKHPPPPAEAAAAAAAPPLPPTPQPERILSIVIVYITKKRRKWEQYLNRHDLIGCIDNTPTNSLQTFCFLECHY